MRTQLIESRREWSNYPTWLVYFYIKSDPQLRESVAAGLKDATESERSDRIKAAFLRRYRVPQRPVYKDLCHWGLKEVDWLDVLAALGEGDGK